MAIGIEEVREGLLQEEEQGDEQTTTFTIDLFKTGEKGSGYHIKNDPRAPHQRNTITSENASLIIHGKSSEIIHGLLNEDPDKPATLLVYDFTFEASKLARRILSADVKFLFSSCEPGEPAPNVKNFAPEGRFALLPTSRETSATHGSEVSTQVAGQPFMQFGGSYKLDTTVTQTMTDYTKIFGGPICGEYGGDCVGVRWTLHENPSTKTGIPSALRTAILLERTDKQEFQCTVTFSVKADWKTELTRFFGTTFHDDPVIYNPELPPTNSLRESYDTMKLGEVRLEDFSHAHFHATFHDPSETGSDAQKEKESVVGVKDGGTFVGSTQAIPAQP